MPLPGRISIVSNSSEHQFEGFRETLLSHASTTRESPGTRVSQVSSFQLKKYRAPLDREMSLAIMTIREHRASEGHGVLPPLFTPLDYIQSARLVARMATEVGALGSKSGEYLLFYERVLAIHKILRINSNPAKSPEPARPLCHSARPRADSARRSSVTCAAECVCTRIVRRMSIKPLPRAREG